ncbi:MAG: hypothetical protein H8E36_11430 [Rhodospirillaceae bacterium]|nr:hypothetical protein [Rhodospirillaceae bacterium]
MATEVDKLLTLKAFYLARSILMKPQRVSDALKMIEVAVKALEKRTGNQEKLRLLFYILIKCEIHRESEECIDIRERAKGLSVEIRSKAYDYYMAIEEVTQTTKQVHGFSAGVIADNGVKIESHRVGQDYFGNTFEYYHDYASATLGVELNSLRKQDLNFLKNTNLMEVLTHHGIAYPKNV